MKYTVFDAQGIPRSQCYTLPAAEKDAQALAEEYKAGYFLVCRTDITKRLRRFVVYWDVEKATVQQLLEADIALNQPDFYKLPQIPGRTLQHEKPMETPDRPSS